MVKRLYRSSVLKKLFPDKAQRLRHIFGRQIYALVPTEIIYRIAVKYLLGFEIAVERHNLRQVNALPAAVEGKLDEFLTELFDAKKSAFPNGARTFYFPMAMIVSRSFVSAINLSKHSVARKAAVPNLLIAS